MRPDGSSRPSFEDRSRRWDIDCLSRLCLGRRFCCRCCRNVDDDGSLPTFDLVPSQRPTLCPTKLPHLVIPRYATRPIPFPNRCQNHVHQHFQHYARLRLRISSLNCCGYAQLLELVHEKYLSTCHLNPRIFSYQHFSYSSM